MWPTYQAASKSWGGATHVMQRDLSHFSTTGTIEISDISNT